MGLIMNKKVMVNNPTNINKTNNHLSFQTFEQKKRLVYMVLEIQVLAWYTRKN